MVAGRRAARRGFTLIEILLVLGLSFIGLFGMMTVVVAAQRASMSARSLSEATALAQDKLEQLAHLPLASLAGGTETTLTAQGVSAAGGLYTRTTTVAVNGAATTVRVRVSWNDTANRAHTVDLSTVRAP